MTNLQSFQNYAESCGCDHSDDKKKKSKITKEEIIKEYGDPRVGARLKLARAIDSTFKNKPKYNSKRAKLSNALKMSSIKADTKRRQQKENPYSAGKKVKMAIRSMSEEGYDRYKDNIVMAGGDPSSPKKSDATTANHTRNNETDAQRKARMLRQQKNSAKAVEMVKKSITDKYGKGAIMDVSKKKNEEVQLGEGKKNCGCGQDPCITYGKDKNAHKMPDGTVMPGKTHKEEAKAKYDNTKSPDYEKKRKALAKKHGGEENIKGHPQYENRMASHTAGMSDAQKDMASSQVSKGFAYKHGRRLDKANFGDRKKAGKRGNPPSYRKSADSPEMELRYPYGKSNIRQGKGSFKGLKKEELLKSLRGFMGEGKIADAMRANLEKMKASDAKSSKNLENFLKKSKKVRDDEKKAQDNS